jgi:hypothetical protein
MDLEKPGKQEESDEKNFVFASGGLFPAPRK